MMAQTFTTVTLRHSFIWYRLVLGIHLLVLLAIGVTPWPWFARLAIGVWVGLSVCRIWLLQRRGRVRTLRLDHSGPAWEQDVQGDWVPVTVRATRFIHPWITILVLNPDQPQSETQIVLPDSCDPDAFRQLRRWLKLNPVA